MNKFFKAFAGSYRLLFSNPILICGLVVALSSCEKVDSRFLISDSTIGPLQKGTATAKLSTLFGQDSIVRDTFSKGLTSPRDKIKVFEKGGQLLLTLTQKSDTVPTIEIVQVEDPRYQTDGGIGLDSRFIDIKNQLGIKKIVTTISSVVVFPKKGPLYFTIDKSELPANVRYNNQKIEEVHIPDDAKIKYLMLGWD